MSAGLSAPAVTVFVTSEDQRGKMISISTIILPALILVFGEMVPKSVAARYPESWSLFVIDISFAPSGVSLYHTNNLHCYAVEGDSVCEGSL